MILLWGLMADSPMAMVRAELEKAGAEFFFLDHRQIFNTSIEYVYDGVNKPVCKITTVDGAVINLSDVNVAYVRPYNFRDYAEMENADTYGPLAEKAAGFETQLMSYLNASDIMVINKTGPSATNNSKPYQLSVIREAGFNIPGTFISNDSLLAKNFLQSAGYAIYKSISGVRSIVKKVGEKQLAFINDVEWCHTLFQQVVEGTNYRVHVLGNEVFAVRITSDSLDYRYGQTTMDAAVLPEAVAEKCLRVNKMLGLHFSGIDLMRTDDDEWYCFEVNPSPAYSYFEYNSGLPISRALARFMIVQDREGRLVGTV